MHKWTQSNWRPVVSIIRQRIKPCASLLTKFTISQLSAMIHGPWCGSPFVGDQRSLILKLRTWCILESYYDGYLDRYLNYTLEGNHHNGHHSDGSGTFCQSKLFIVNPWNLSKMDFRVDMTIWSYQTFFRSSPW